MTIMNESLMTELKIVKTENESLKTKLDDECKKNESLKTALKSVKTENKKLKEKILYSSVKRWRKRRRRRRRRKRMRMFLSGR